jgi:uncharacterized protein YndB with AHSA1/START domain
MTMATTRKKTTRRPTVRRPAARRKHALRKAPARRAKSRTQAGLVKRGLAARGLRLAGVGSEAVLRATGRAWDEWLKLLDRAGAKAMPHKDIALMLSRKFAVPDWWSQMVTVGYEQARGLRAVYQRTNGFAANTSRTLDTPLRRVYEAWSDPQLRSRWLLDAPVEVRRATDGKSIRMTWTVGDSDVDVGFFAKGADKSQVQVEHSKLRNATAVAKQKAFWGDALNRLKALLEPVT